MGNIAYNNINNSNHYRGNNRDINDNNRSFSIAIRAVLHQNRYYLLIQLSCDRGL